MTLYQIDAFTNKLFSGNPAAVIPLDKWIDDSLMQELAMENNLSETVFFVPSGSSPEAPAGTDYHIRWFTPAAEINLCGHATLASAYVLFNILGYKKSSVTFHCQSGSLFVTREKDIISMDFPSWKPERLTGYPDGLEQVLGVKEIVGVYKSRDLLVELNSEEDVRNAEPDFTLIKKTGYKIIITAPGGIRQAAGSYPNTPTRPQRPDGLQQRPDPSPPADFVSRFFAPTFGVDEDPVTGSAHSQLIPFWSEKLGKTKMVAKQLSKRGGHLWVEQKGDRVQMGGQC
ncbi:MAG: PhzF family phenazine biosynthesis protein, partial [Bacteroidota bacterium]|nr:PhzF family phenazine biosynthesis protein [Bacteroidota bacterium]